MHLDKALLEEQGKSLIIESKMKCSKVESHVNGKEEVSVIIDENKSYFDDEISGQRRQSIIRHVY